MGDKKLKPPINFNHSTPMVNPHVQNYPNMSRRFPDCNGSSVSRQPLPMYQKQYQNNSQFQQYDTNYYNKPLDPISEHIENTPMLNNDFGFNIEAQFNNLKRQMQEFIESEVSNNRQQMQQQQQHHPHHLPPQQYHQPIPYNHQGQYIPRQPNLPQPYQPTHFNQNYRRLPPQTSGGSNYCPTIQTNDIPNARDLKQPFINNPIMSSVVNNNEDPNDAVIKQFEKVAISLPVWGINLKNDDSIQILNYSKTNIIQCLGTIIEVLNYNLPKCLVKTKDAIYKLRGPPEMLLCRPRSLSSFIAVAFHEGFPNYWEYSRGVLENLSGRWKTCGLEKFFLAQPIVENVSNQTSKESGVGSYSNKGLTTLYNPPNSFQVTKTYGREEEHRLPAYNTKSHSKPHSRHRHISKQDGRKRNLVQEKRLKIKNRKTKDSDTCSVMSKKSKYAKLLEEYKAKEALKHVDTLVPTIPQVTKLPKPSYTQHSTPHPTNRARQKSKLYPIDSLSPIKMKSQDKELGAPTDFLSTMARNSARAVLDSDEDESKDLMKTPKAITKHRNMVTRSMSVTPLPLENLKSKLTKETKSKPKDSPKPVVPDTFRDKSTENESKLVKSFQKTMSIQEQNESNLSKSKQRKRYNATLMEGIPSSSESVIEPVDRPKRPLSKRTKRNKEVAELVDSQESVKAVKKLKNSKKKKKVDKKTDKKGDKNDENVDKITAKKGTKKYIKQREQYLKKTNVGAIVDLPCDEFFDDKENDNPGGENFEDGEPVINFDCEKVLGSQEFANQTPSWFKTPNQSDYDNVSNFNKSQDPDDNLTQATKNKNLNLLINEKLSKKILVENNGNKKNKRSKPRKNSKIPVKGTFSKNLSKKINKLAERIESGSEIDENETIV